MKGSTIDATIYVQASLLEEEPRTQVAPGSQFEVLAPDTPVKVDRCTLKLADALNWRPVGSFELVDEAKERAIRHCVETGEETWVVSRELGDRVVFCADAEDFSRGTFWPYHEPHEPAKGRDAALATQRPLF